MLAEIKEQHNGEKRSKKKSLIGGDGFNFEIAIDGADKGLYLDKVPLENGLGYKYGEVEIKKGTINISLSLPKYVRKDNIIPFGMVDAILFETLTGDFEQALNNALRGIIDSDTDLMSATAKSIECNITMRVVGKSTCSQVLDLMNRSFTETTNTLYQSASTKCKYDKENETVIIPKPNYYKLKCYNKSLEQIRAGNFVEDGLLRIEVVMLKRTIAKLFGDDCTARDVLTKQGLKKIIAEYKRIFDEEVIRKHIEPCLTDVTEILYESLMETNNPRETIARYKQFIMDERIFRKALIKWYVSKGYSKESAKRNAATYICRNKEKYGFPENVIDTIREFGKLCK